MKKKIILASSSPRRKELLTKMGLEFEIIPSNYEEILDTLDFSYTKIEELAYCKAKDVYETLKNSTGYDNSIILSADTVVVLNEKILVKPKNEEEAIQMLTKLSGKKHSVVTSLCFINVDTLESKLFSETSFVEFENLTSEMIQKYVYEYKPLDKAGSYGIQELPDGFIKEIVGSFENIMGLCPKAVNKIFKNLPN